jgi:hypothetical protein
MILEPGNRINALVYGEDASYHPVTKMAIQRGSGALSIPEQARGHLRVIAHHHGIDVAREMAHKLDEFERNGGVIEMPVPRVPRGFERVLMKG